MWHEARKQERLIRGLIVDYRRRAERRKDFYEKTKAEPTQFLQLHGRPCKIHLDPAVAAAVDSPGIMMPWQGDSTTMIDRFDVRAHLDYIPEVKIPEVSPANLDLEERQCNYERYRILAQNNFLGAGEVKFLQQLSTEERFGVTMDEREAAKDKLYEKKGSGAAIGYNYNDPGSQPSCSTGLNNKYEGNSDDESDLEIIDVDLCIDVNKMEPSQAHELNALGPKYGMTGCDLFSFLTADADDVEHEKQLLREEKEKAMYSGRKSRRERRAHREKRLSSRVGLSPPSYAAPSEKTRLVPTKSPSRSRSPSPKGPEKIEFITSFGGDDDENKPSGSKPLFSDKVKINLKKKNTLYSEIIRGTAKQQNVEAPRQSAVYGPQQSNYRNTRSRSRSLRSRSRSARSRTRSPRSRSRSPRSRSRSPRSHKRSPYRPSVSKSPSRSRSRSYSRPRSRFRSYSRSRSRSSSRSYRGKSRSRSPFYRRNRSRSNSFSSEEASKPAVPRYYGRKKDDKETSSGMSLDSDTSDEESKKKSVGGSKTNTNQSQIRSGSSNKGPSKETLTLKERLKRKMQAQLSRQLRIDQRNAAERTQREERNQAQREEEMRELALKLRRKHREMRHRRSSDDSDSSSSRDSKERPRNKSKSPPPKRVVWAKDEVSQPPKDQNPIDYRRVPPVYESREIRLHDSRPYYHNRDQNYQKQRFECQSNFNRDGDKGDYRMRPKYNNVEQNWEPNRNFDRPENSDDSKKVKLVDY